MALEFDLFIVTFLLVRNFDGKTGADFALQIIDVEVERSELILIKFSDTGIQIRYIKIRLLILSLISSLLLPIFLRLLIRGTS